MELSGGSVLLASAAKIAPIMPCCGAIPKSHWTIVIAALALALKHCKKVHREAEEGCEEMQDLEEESWSHLGPLRIFGSSPRHAVIPQL